MKLIKIQNEIKVISALKVEEIEKLTKLEKNTVKDADKNPVFAVSFAENKPSSSKYGITFSETTDDGYAMITVVCVPNDKDTIVTTERFVEDNLAMIVNLKAAETELKAILETVSTTVEGIAKDMSEITITGGNR